ncbi:NADH:quinone oxidoreductase I, membrane subunit L [Campylobacter vicugnae]|uniref:NADH:quinone oxidoreductase I, membrane subunit L n=1 Tax=Campylobacter vicugnae TaxID=1660076 RepID=A0A1X9T3L4_9BACT|nr:NADH-quinone oxidoreductase subunit L [Campylobacter sp. RM8964]ARR03095.1 NADH:quinone oxidoreductase I, membrane subunit L [Campylobacter sp. RM8964]
MLVNIVILAPIIGSLFLGILYLARTGLGLSQGFFAFLGMIGPVVSFIAMAVLFTQSYGSSINLELFSWLDIAGFSINVGFYLDSLSLVMALFVAFLGMLIHLYSIGYMDGDEGFGKFFCYMNLFLASMLILVLANNPILMFVGWEGVGVCSYLLIAFYFSDKDNVKAGNKAFILNRIGDFGFLIGLIALYLASSGVKFDYIGLNEITLSPNVAIFIAFCFIAGALAKSAQIPLYTWLPDAMAGPTPISALIHAATMVTAGVYMVVRFDFLFAGLSLPVEVLAGIGAAGALFAGIIATKATDIKKILAYSTMSQLGYMFAALSYSSGAAMYHLFTHGFFKALLFLSAGAIIIALHHEQNIFKMGNLKSNKALYYPMLFGMLAISGIFPFAGFFSKDAIILGALLSGHYVIFSILLFTAGLTAYYCFRLFFLVFYSQNQAPHQHKVPFTMLSVNYLLCLFALGGGFMAIFLDIDHPTLMVEIIAGVASMAVSGIGIFIAYKKFYNYKNCEESMGKFESIVANRFYIDEIYELIFVKSLKRISHFMREIIDDRILYPLVEFSALMFRGFGQLYAKYTQNGLASSYAFYMLFFVCVIIIFSKAIL